MNLPLPLPKFLSWYQELGKLNIFWAKPLNKPLEVHEHSHSLILKAEWLVRGKPREGLLIALRAPFQLTSILEELPLSNHEPVHLLMDEDASPPLPSHCTINAHSILYFWHLNKLHLLEPNHQVEVELYEQWGSTIEEHLRRVQKQSWGFYIPPRAGDHLVLLAKLNGEAVGSTYFNVNNANLDYGVHVVRSHWRKRIGTRILHEAAQQARARGFPYFSVVRVLRRVGGTSSDKRALSFYRANNPFVRLKALRLAMKP